jgi:hypothetical protein
MPLNDSIPRRLIHNRSIALSGYCRDDGLWEIEGRLLDTKGYDLSGLYRKHIPAGEPIHDMSVRLTIDDDLIIRDVAVVTDWAPFPMCADITPVFAQLKGVGLGRGFMRFVRDRFGGTSGCTHIAELLGAIASTAFQTVYPVLRHERGDMAGRPDLIDSCHAFAADGEVVARQWPQFATAKAA